MTYSSDQDKIDKYQDVVTRATTDIWNHMINRTDGIPDSVSDLTERQMEILMDIESVEAEWILDPDMRQTVSLIQWADDDDEDDSDN